VFGFLDGLDGEKLRKHIAALFRFFVGDVSEGGFVLAKRMV
jgi:hypothetical protein